MLTLDWAVVCSLRVAVCQQDSKHRLLSSAKPSRHNRLFKTTLQDLATCRTNPRDFPPGRTSPGASACGRLTAERRASLVFAAVSSFLFISHLNGHKAHKKHSQLNIYQVSKKTPNTCFIYKMFQFPKGEL